MKIIFEINHPGHIHLFKNLAVELEKNGHHTNFLIKSDPIIEQLVKHYGLTYFKMGTKVNGLIRKILFQPLFLYKTIRFAQKHSSEMGLGVSMNLPMVSKFTKMISICFDDDDMNMAPVFSLFANKASVILTPSSFAHEKRGQNHRVFPGFHELAYLHPNKFIPDNGVFDLLGLPKNSDYFLVRFNSFNAHHDVGVRGMSFEQKRTLVNKLEKKGRVFISSESEIDPDFVSYVLPDRPEWMHSVLAFARMYVGESQTMTSEAAVLGTPALKCNTVAGKLTIPNELEQNYGLCYSFLPEDFDNMLTRIDELLAMPDIKAEWQKRRLRMLQDKIDVTAFLAWLVEDYPESVEIIKKEPEYAYRFK